MARPGRATCYGTTGHRTEACLCHPNQPFQIRRTSFGLNTSAIVQSFFSGCKSIKRLVNSLGLSSRAKKGKANRLKRALLTHHLNNASHHRLFLSHILHSQTALNGVLADLSRRVILPVLQTKPGGKDTLLWPQPGSYLRRFPLPPYRPKKKEACQMQSFMRKYVNILGLTAHWTQA